MSADATDLCFDARLKIKRANEHISDMNAAILALEQTYIPTIEHDPSTGIQQLTHSSKELEFRINEISLIVGDAIHNLRAALDFAWHFTVERHGIRRSSRKHRKFPVCDSGKKLEDALRSIEVHTICPPLFQLLVSEIQPYKGGKNEVIWALNEIDIADKHLLLLDLAPWGTIRDIIVKDATGQISKGRGMPMPGSDRYTIGFAPGFHIEGTGNLSVAVTLKEAGIFHGVPISSLLPSFSSYVLHVVKLLENL